MEIFNLIPLATKFSILFLVILPAFFMIYLRFSLHTRLQSINRRVSRLLISGEEEGIQPEIVTRLRIRYQTASEKLEHVNTIALIDSIYQEETIAYGEFTVQYDRVDSITRVLPNLLIAFGLIGTFLGITSNLTNISTIVTGFSQNNPDVGGLVQGLQKPLQDMGVAFSSSLFGLLFGSGLTIVNTIFNTSIAKHQLISGLEDYLDNIYKPTVEGNTRLDKAIEKMVNQQQDFLINFHKNVGQVLEITFGKAANQISEECSRINSIAENVYTNFSNAAGTISTGASTFEYAANSLELQTKNLANSLDKFQGGVEIFNLAANKLEQNNIVQNIDRVLAKLNLTQTAFTTSTQTLQDSLIGITSSNQTAAQLAQQVYQTWQDSTNQIVAASETIGAGAIIFQKATTALEAQTQAVVELIPQLKTGVDTFVSAANKVKTNNIIKHLNTLVENLGVTQSAFASSTETLAAGVEGIRSSHQQATQIAEQVYQGLEMTTATIQTGANNFVSAAQMIQDSSRSIDLTLSNAANQWQNTQAEFTNSTAIFSQASKNIEPVAAKLAPAIAAIDRAVDHLQQVGSEVVNLSKNTAQISASTQTAITGFDRNYQQVLNSTRLSIEDINKINSYSWQSLIDSLNLKYQADRTQSLQSMEAMKAHYAQISLPDSKYFARLLTILEKLEIGLTTDRVSSGERKSGFLGLSQRN
jgi:exonuclease VII small subunit